MSRFTIEAILTAKDQGFSSTMDKCMGKAESFGDKLKSGLGFGAWMAIGQKAVGFVFNEINQNMDGAVRRLDTLNNFPKVMQSLGFSAEDASKGIDHLADGIDHLPTTLDAVASQAQQLVPLTGDIEKATDITLALNNAMAGGGKSAQEQQSAIEAWTKAMAKGKPDFEQWQRMIQTAPAQMDQLSKAIMGDTANQNDLYEALKSGKISMEEVNDKMIELTNASEGFDIAGRHYDNFATQAKNASAGIQMSIGNVKASIQRNLAGIMDTIDQLLADFGGISGVIQGLVGPIDTLGASIKALITGELSIGDAIENLFTLLGEKAQELIPKGMEMVSNFITGITSQLPQIMTAGANLLADLAMGIVQGIPTLLEAGLNALANFLDGFASGRNQIMSRAVEIIKVLVKGLIKALPKILKAGWNVIKALVKSIGSGFSTLLDAGKDMLKFVAEGIGKGLAWIIKKALEIPKIIINKIKEHFGQFQTSGKDVLSNIGKGILGAISGLAQTVLKIPKMIIEKIKGGKYQSEGKSVVSALGSGLLNGLSALGGVASKVMNKIKSVFKGEKDRVTNIGKQTTDAFANGMKNVEVVGKLKETATTVADKVVNALKGVNAWGAGKNFSQGFAEGIEDNVYLATQASALVAQKALEKLAEVIREGSPSKVTMQSGEYFTEGFAIGIEKKQNDVQNAIAGLVDLASPFTMGRMGFQGAFSSDYSYNTTARYEIIVPVELNGREIARASATEMQAELNRVQTAENRKRGIR